MRILLVEDNVMNQKVARKLLEKWGHQVEVADNGVLALNAVEKREDKRFPFDLILMDLQMPEMDGVTATKEIRLIETRDKIVPTPIVALTANTDEKDRDRCFEAGMNDYTTKPIKAAMLFNLLETIRDTCPSAAA